MLILYNARINRHKPVLRFSAIAIQDQFIIDIGESDEVVSRYGQSAQLINMDGKTIWPGLIDAHIHLEKYGFSLQQVDCQTPSLDECLKNVADKVAKVHPGEWIIGHGWNQNDWAGKFGNADQLDLVAPENPVYLTSKSIHSAWINSFTMRLAGISNNSQYKNYPGVQIDSNGIPTGILFESAMKLCVEIIPAPSPHQIKEAILLAQKNLLKFGITCVHDFDQTECFSTLQSLNEKDELCLRVIKGIPGEVLPQTISLGLRTGFGDDHLRIGPVKLFTDGALGPLTAAMISPYEKDPDNRGLLLMDTEQIVEIGQEAVMNGLSLAIHAIGDRANREVIDAYAQLRDFEIENHIPALRHRIEHVQLLDPVDINRLSKYNIIASMQPLHATSDMLMADQNWGDRSRTAYAWRSLISNNTLLAFGSDAPVESPNPFWGIHAAVTRCRQDGSPDKNGWYPEQRISLIEAVNAYTFGSAYAGGIEDRIGILEPGYYADLLIIDEDPLSIPPDMIHTVKPESTMIGGKWVYGTT